MQYETISTLNMSRADWLAYRQSKIGGSDIAGIVGVPGWRWSSPMSVYSDKKGLTPPKECNEAMELGTDLEDFIARKFTQRTGLEVQRRNSILVSKQWDKAIANIDRLIIAKGTDYEAMGPGILECKNTSEYMRHYWQDEDTAPMAYYLQLQWYFYVTGYQWGYFAAMIGGNTIVTKFVQRDDEIIESIVPIVKAFWHNHIEADVPPAPDGSSATTEVLNKLYPNSEAESLDLEGDAELYEDLQAAKQQEKIAKERKELCIQRIKVIMAEAEAATFGYDDSGKLKKCTWRTQERTTFDTKALKIAEPEVWQMYAKTSTSRVFK